MKTHSSPWFLAASLLVASCANPVTPVSPTATSDPRYLAGTLASWEDAQDAGQADDNPAEGLLGEDVPASRSAAAASSIVDNGDGTVTITRTGRHWMGTVITKVLVRQKEPGIDALPMDGDTATTTGTETWYLGGAETSMATIAVTANWRNEAGAVRLSSVTRTGDRLGWGGGQPHLLTVAATYSDGTLVEKTVTHYSGTIAPENLLYTEEFHRSSDVTVIVKKDAEGEVLGSRSVTKTGTGSQSVRRYDAGGVLRQVAIRTPTESGWTVERTRYRSDGVTEKWTTSEVVTLTVAGATTHVVRDITGPDGVVRRVSLDVEVEGDTYTITVTGPGETTTWTATQSSGTWTLTPAVGDPVVVDASDAV